MPKLDFDADTFQDALNYFVQRDLQVCETGWRLRYIEHLDNWGALARFDNGNERRFAVYVFASHRGEGKLTEFAVNNYNLKFITVDDCNVASFYEKHGRDCLVLKTEPGFS